MPLSFLWEINLVKCFLSVHTISEAYSEEQARLSPAAFSPVKAHFCIGQLISGADECDLTE